MSFDGSNDSIAMSFDANTDQTKPPLNSFKECSQCAEFKLQRNLEDAVPCRIIHNKR